MSMEVLSTIASVGTFIVIGATAIAAVIQLRHLRASNQLEGLLTVLARVEDPNFNAWVDGARNMLRTKMADANYRRRIRDGTFDRENNPWLNLANSYEWVGSLVKNKLIPEVPFMDVYSSRVMRAWDLMEPLVAITRRRSPAIWENFEYLAVRARLFNERFPNGTYPRGVQRKQIADIWLAQDTALGQA